MANVDFGAILGFIRGIFAVGDHIEKSEAKQVVRALRTIYFYPDRSLGCIDKLISSGGRDEEAVSTLRDIFHGSEQEVNGAVDLLTSKSVATNIHIPLDILESLRGAVVDKLNVRKIYSDLALALELGAGPTEIVDAAVRVKQDIVELNDQLREIEKLIGAHHG